MRWDVFAWAAFALVLIAAEAEVAPADPHLHAALASLLDEQEKLSAKLITGFQDPTPYGDDA